MPISTYSELVTAVGSWVNRADMAATIPLCIALAEASIRRTLRVRTVGPSALGTISPTAPALALPADCREVRDVAITSPLNFAVEIVSPAQFSDRKGKYRNALGIPMVASVSGTGLRFAPTPDREYEVELAYFQKLPDLTEAAPTNWLLTDAPDVYLYGVLTHLAPFLMEDERLPVWLGGFDKALTELERQRDMDEYGAGPLTITSSVSF